MVSQIVEKLRKIGVHPVVVSPITGANRHQRRTEDAKARSYRDLSQRKPTDWQAAQRKRRKTAAASRKRNRAQQ